MAELVFPESFLWGVSTSAYQIEGSHDADGKGESIWDRFSHIPGKIANNDNGDIACDHYRRFREDVRLLKELGIKSYRFSISWPRIFPDGKGRVNQKGLDFYKDLAGELAENGIIPMATLYHWDLPQKLQDNGGWLNRDTASYFAEYAGLAFSKIGGIRHWATFNEPWVSSFVGHWLGGHPPGFTDFSRAVSAAHNTLVAHGKAVRIFRESGLAGEIGIVLNLNPVYPAAESREDYDAALRYGEFLNGWFLDPVLKGKYPEKLAGRLSEKKNLPEFHSDDMKIINTPVDYIGMNTYTASCVKNNPGIQPLELSFLSTGKPVTDTGWEIYPEGLYDLLKYIDETYKGIKIIITENGAAFRDKVNQNNEVEDSERIKYLNEHIAQVHRALGEGVNLAGYYVWSFLDNFEWKMGYDKRFGLVYVDYETQERIIKNSGHWFANICKTGRLQV